MRGVLHRSDVEFTTLGDEMALIRAYLEIEQTRFEERLRVEFDVPAALASIRVPALLLQPIVENAVKHGIGQAKAGGRVSVSAARHVDAVIVTVTDTSAGFDQDHTSRLGVGLIVDDEPRRRISDVTKAEGRRGQSTLFTFTVTLSAAYDQAVTLSYRTADSTAKTSVNNYGDKTGTLTFAPGETTKTITIEVKGDSKKEANEYFYLDLFGNSGSSLFTKNRGTGTILTDD